MKKILTFIISTLCFFTANAQDINGVVTRQDKENKGWYQFSETPNVVLGTGNTISFVADNEVKEQYTLSDGVTFTVLFSSIIDENVDATDLTVSHPILIKNNGVLTVSGTMTNTKTEDLVINGGQLITNNSVKATVMKNITKSDNFNSLNWYTISSPLATNTAFADIENLIPTTVTANDYNLYRLDEVSYVWINTRIYDIDGTTVIANPNFTTIDKGIGYIYSKYNTSDIAFKGDINIDNVNVDVTKTAEGGNGNNILGNPFTCNIKLTDITGTSLADGYYILNNDNTWATEISTTAISPLQGFLVEATEMGEITINKPNTTSRGEESDLTNIEIIVSNDSFRDNSYAVLGEGIGLSKVNHLNAKAPMVYVPQNGNDYAIAFFDESTTLLPVAFVATTAGEYEIRLKTANAFSTLLLIDNMTGVETNMLLEDNYSFTATPDDMKNRFTVKLSLNEGGDDEQFINQYDSELLCNGEGLLQVFDMLGRMVINEEVHGQTVNISNLNKGVYVVRLTGEKIRTQKIIVK